MAKGPNSMNETGWDGIDTAMRTLADEKRLRLRRAEYERRERRGDWRYEVIGGDPFVGMQRVPRESVDCVLRCPAEEPLGVGEHTWRRFPDFPMGTREFADGRLEQLQARQERAER